MQKLHFFQENIASSATTAMPLLPYSFTPTISNASGSREPDEGV